jgi:hypothetical protein
MTCGGLPRTGIEAPVTMNLNPQIHARNMA